MAMTEKQLASIVDSMEANFRDLGWSKVDIIRAQADISLVLMLLLTLNAPLMEKTFPESLRALANSLDIIRKENEIGNNR